MKDIMKEIERAKEILKNEHGMSTYEVEVIYRNSKDIYELTYNSFLFGYFRGLEAAK